MEVLDFTLEGSFVVLGGTGEAATSASVVDKGCLNNSWSSLENPKEGDEI